MQHIQSYPRVEPADQVLSLLSPFVCIKTQRLQKGFLLQFYI
jgi:hypothetical protein